MKTPVLAGLAAIGLLLTIPAAVNAQDPDGFDGYIQGGTCAAPDDDLRVNLKGGGEHDVEPYKAKGPDGDVVLGYYGSPEVPGFGVSVIYTEQKFSLVITDTSGKQVACGDLLRPDADRFAEAGVAAVQLLPVGDSGVQGVAAVQRTRLQRELDVTPARVRILLTDEDSVTPPTQAVDGYNGLIQGGTCENPRSKVRVQLRSQADFDVVPYRAKPDGGDPVTLAYVGRPWAPGYGLATAYTGVDFSLVVTDAGGATVSCGDILEPSSSTFTEAGLALVRLEPVGGSGAPGFALIQRVAL
jgi:hypothetical protein